MSKNLKIGDLVSFQGLPDSNKQPDIDCFDGEILITSSILKKPMPKSVDRSFCYGSNYNKYFDTNYNTYRVDKKTKFLLVKTTKNGSTSLFKIYGEELYFFYLGSINKMFKKYESPGHPLTKIFK